MNTRVKSHSLNWTIIKSVIKKKFLNGKNSNAKVNQDSLENIELILKKHFKELYNNPIEFLKYEKNIIKVQFAQHKNNKKLNSVEETIINNIYDFLLNHLEDSED